MSVIALPPGGRIRPVCHRSWCRGDLTSGTLSGALRPTALDADPRVNVVQRRPFRHAAVAWTAAVAGVQPVCWAQRTLGVRRLVSARRLQQSRRGRGCLPPTAARRGRCLGGANPCGLAPRADPFGGADSRASHEETARPHRQTHLISGPAAAGCQSPHSRGMGRLSSRHFSGPSTCPRKRVFKSFP